MRFVSITRLRVRAFRFLLDFAVQALRSQSQARSAEGFRGGSVLADRKFTFWTMTLWDHQDSMRAYMLTGDHRAAMPRLLDWCDEASVVHWEQAEDTLPAWTNAAERMRQEGRPSKVRNPSPNHADLTFAAPRLTTAASIAPRHRR